MSSHIVARLRHIGAVSGQYMMLCKEAADEIERLRAIASNFAAFIRGEYPSLATDDDHNVFDFMHEFSESPCEMGPHTCHWCKERFSHSGDAFVHENSCSLNPALAVETKEPK